MDHINLFQTNAEFLSAYNGSDYVEPWLSFTIETSGISYNKEQTPPPYSSMPLTIEIVDGSGSITLNRYNIKYKLNDGNWVEESSPTISVSNGDKIQLKEDYEIAYTSGGYIPLITDSSDSNDFKYMIYGNIMSVYQETGFEDLTAFTNEETYVFANLFGGCSCLISAENLTLPATELTEFCYDRMFSGCTSLTTAPELPATTLAGYCYDGMFEGCTSLTTAPELPVTTLAQGCYASIFQDCTSLTTAPTLPATTMVQGCYNGMFKSCTALTTAPELLATTLTHECYYGMFSGCTSLNYIKCLATDISAYNCTNSWVDGVASTGTFVKANTADWSSKTGSNGIPNGWTVQNAN